MNESDISELKISLKKELKFWIWVITIVIAVIVGTVPLIANKLFYEEELKRTQERLERNEERLIKLEDAYFTVTFNISRLCEKEGIDYKPFPRNK